MKFSLITATYNRAHGIAQLLDSIATSFRQANVTSEAEIVIVDNNSTDATKQAIATWMAAHPDIQVQHLFEPKQGVCRARNRGIEAARGKLLAFTDDDCLLTPAYVEQALAYDARDTEPLIRGGRVELYDPNAIALTIKTDPTPETWSLAQDSARHANLTDCFIGCNVSMRKSTALAIGPFDTRLGPGSRFRGGEDMDQYYRAYLMGMKLIYVPDMVIQHNHGRMTREDGHTLIASYSVANGALFAKYLFRHPIFCRPFLWDLKNAIKDTLARRNSFMPQYGFSHGDKIRCYLRGALLYYGQSLGIVNYAR